MKCRKKKNSTTWDHVPTAKKKTPEIRESAHESLNKWETCSRNS